MDWYPWGREALERAKRENKPIFLSVGYSTCYWCHVANETLYANPEIAALMNRWFINIKVNREQPAWYLPQHAADSSADPHGHTVRVHDPFPG